MLICIKVGMAGLLFSRDATGTGREWDHLRRCYIWSISDWEKIVNNGTMTWPIFSYCSTGRWNGTLQQQCVELPL